MNAFMLASMAAAYVLNHVPLLPDILYETMSPLSFPPYRSDGIRSPDVHVDNEVYNEYLKFWMTGQLEGIHKWLALFMLVKKSYPNFALSPGWDSFLRMIHDVIPPYMQLNEWMIPMVRVVAPGDVAIIVGVPFSEYKTELDLSPGDFIRHVLQITLFGFPVIPSIVQAFRIPPKELAHYIRERLAQGAFDESLRGRKIRSSYFMPDEGMSASDRSHLLAIGKQTIPFLKQKQMYPGVHVAQSVEEHLRAVRSLGVMSEEIRQLNRLRAFKYQNRRYMDYLERSKLGANTHTLGPAGFAMLVRRYASPSHQAITMSGGPAIVPDQMQYDDLGSVTMF